MSMNFFYELLGKTSTAIHNLKLNPGNGSAIVEYNNGGTYLYRNLDKGSLGSALIECNSLGKFVNSFIKGDGVECIQLY